MLADQLANGRLAEDTGEAAEVVHNTLQAAIDSVVGARGNEASSCRLRCPSQLGRSLLLAFSLTHEQDVAEHRWLYLTNDKSSRLLAQKYLI